MSQEVTNYINLIEQKWQVEICNRIREIIHQNIPDIKEQVKYKQAFYTLKDKQVCVYFPAKNWINITLFKAETLEAPEGFFEPSSKLERKTIKIHQEQPFNYDVLAKLLQQVAKNII